MELSRPEARSPGPQTLGHLQCFPGQEQGAGSAKEQPDSNQHPYEIWHHRGRLRLPHHGGSLLPCRLTGRYTLRPEPGHTPRNGPDAASHQARSPVRQTQIRQLWPGVGVTRRNGSFHKAKVTSWEVDKQEQPAQLGSSQAKRPIPSSPGWCHLPCPHPASVTTQGPVWTRAPSEEPLV